MFDKPVDIIQVYGALPPNIKPKEQPVQKSSDKSTRKYRSSSFIYREYQAMRKTDEFRVWWKRQYARQHALCYYCKESLKTKRINVEHIVPMSRGGTNNKKNMVLSCADCNKDKGSKLLKKKVRRALRTELQKQIREDRKRFNYQKKLDVEIGFELREMFKE